MMTVTYAQSGGGLVVDVLVGSQKGLDMVGGSGGLSSSVTLTVTAMLPVAGGMPLRIWVAGSNARFPAHRTGGQHLRQDSAVGLRGVVRQANLRPGR